MTYRCGRNFHKGPRCRATIEVEDPVDGQEILCRRCGAKFVVRTDREGRGKPPILVQIEQSFE